TRREGSAARPLSSPGVSVVLPRGVRPADEEGLDLPPEAGDGHAGAGDRRQNALKDHRTAAGIDIGKGRLGPAETHGEYRRKRSGQRSAPITLGPVPHRARLSPYP